MRTNQSKFGHRPHNRISCIPFGREKFLKLVQQVSAPDDGDWPANQQTVYLAAYLESLGTKTLVVEHHYIDRHFMEEVSLYYSKSLLPRPNWTTRIHVFNEEFTERELDRRLQLAAIEELGRVRKAFQATYCGYIVIRPLPSVPVGRTVLRHLHDKSERSFPTCLPYTVHFLGIELQVRGLAFQQQDRAVAACATTAVWTALQRVCRREGARPPTSWEITEAAVRHYLPNGRPFPSSGLSLEQICEALRSFCFAPDIVKAAGAPEEFLLLLDTYLRSGIPVILLFVTGGGGHAVTCVGYSTPASEGTPYSIQANSRSYSVIFRNLLADRVFLHDDRLGPYARAEFEIENRQDEKGHDSPQLIISIEWPNGNKEKAVVYAAATPLYPKLRTNARELLETAMDMLPIVHTATEDYAGDLGLGLHFERSGDYQASLYDRAATPARIARFQKRISLSRYVGVHRWFLGDTPFLETVWDTTDTMRETKYSENLLGIVCLDKRFRELTDGLAELHGAVAG